MKPIATTKSKIANKQILLLIECYEENNFLLSFILLLASGFSFVLDEARYAIEQTSKNSSTIK